RQLEDVERVPVVRMSDVGNEYLLRTWAATAEASWDGDVLLAIDLEGDREALDRRAEAHLPQHFACRGIEGVESTIEVAREDETPRRTEYGRTEGCPLFVLPENFHRFSVYGRKLALEPVGARHG